MYNPTYINRAVAWLLKYENFLMVLSNLVLVLVTIANVWLTRQTLSALRETSLREREARHLQDIKDNVIQPIVSWIKSTVVHRFTIGAPGLLAVAGGYSGIPRQVTHTVDDPFTPRQRLQIDADSEAPDLLNGWESLDMNRVSEFLYHHAKRDHFPEELEAFDSLLREIRNVTNSFVTFANQCAERVAEIGILPALHAEDENSIGQFANNYLLAAESINLFLWGEKSLKVRGPSGSPVSFLITTGNQNIAKAPEPQSRSLTEWFDDATGRMREQWEGSRLMGDVSQMLINARSVCIRIEALLFTQSLGVDCELVSGKKKRRSG